MKILIWGLQDREDVHCGILADDAVWYRERLQHLGVNLISPSWLFGTGVGYLTTMAVERYSPCQ